RVDNILTKNGSAIERIVRGGSAGSPASEPVEAERALARTVERLVPRIDLASRRKCYDDVVDSLAEFIDPVERFFTDCLVVDPEDPETTRRRHALLIDLKQLFTKYFDIRELAGEADGEAQ
ncbi:MAG TPA: DALR anticodon-binding domain-containing protein, partial [Candidatus Polarisedimenticolaceae bacterium]|nr:DALR anticodon-binding domain-containing protein [Candidatus Polarisedimenticolaceae bacterium]